MAIWMILKVTLLVTQVEHPRTPCFGSDLAGGKFGGREFRTACSMSRKEVKRKVLDPQTSHSKTGLLPQHSGW